MKLAPLASRLIPLRERKRLSGLSALIGREDQTFVSNVIHTLYERGFDIYLGGEIIQNAINNNFGPYSRIDLFATIEIEEIRKKFIDRLKISEGKTGSDKWIHFGSVIQKREGFKIKDFYKGSKFYCTPINLLKYKLEPAIYSALNIEPTPIYLYFPPSLRRFTIT